MPGETQEEFIERVRGALKHRGELVPLPDDLEVARVVGREEDLVARFLISVEQAKMIPHRVPDAASLAAKVLELCRALPAFGELGRAARTAIVPVEAWPGRDEILAALKAENIELLDADGRDAAFVADVSITGVELAVAETGSMCLISGDGRRRLASLAVPVHIGVVRADQIVPDLLDWAVVPLLSSSGATGATVESSGTSGGRPACEVLVSGPSKTADIELTLVMGVHGPRVEHVIVVG